MFNRLAPLAAACVLAPLSPAPLALADPPPPADPRSRSTPPLRRRIPAPSRPKYPASRTAPTAGRWRCRRTTRPRLAIPPPTTALSSREYLVGGTFTGVVKGNGKTKLTGGVLEAGYQIGCGISLNTVKPNGSVGLGITTTALGAVPTGLSFPIQGQIEVHPQPGEVINVSVDKKSFKQAPARVTLRDVHVKIDGCAGQSFLRSYAQHQLEHRQ